MGRSYVAGPGKNMWHPRMKVEGFAFLEKWSGPKEIRNPKNTAGAIQTFKVVVYFKLSWSLQGDWTQMDFVLDAKQFNLTIWLSKKFLPKIHYSAWLIIPWFHWRVFCDWWGGIIRGSNLKARPRSYHRYVLEYHGRNREKRRPSLFGISGLLDFGHQLEESSVLARFARDPTTQVVSLGRGRPLHVWKCASPLPISKYIL